jgi:sec-independent protein translocase protein TatA
MPGIGPMEMVVVLVIALVILGPKRLPAAGRSLGSGMREFKDSLTSHHDKDEAPEVAPVPPVPATTTATAPREG